MHVIKNEYLRVPKNEYLHENNQNLNKNGYGNNGGCKYSREIPPYSH